jgi:hypothetical protein
MARRHKQRGLDIRSASHARHAHGIVSDDLYGGTRDTEASFDFGTHRDPLDMGSEDAHGHVVGLVPAVVADAIAKEAGADGDTGAEDVVHASIMPSTARDQKMTRRTGVVARTLPCPSRATPRPSRRVPAGNITEPAGSVKSAAGNTPETGQDQCNGLPGATGEATH